MAALLVDVHAANVASSSFTIPCPATPDVHAKEPSPIMVEEDVVQNVVTEDAMDIGEVSNMARSEPSPEPSHVASPALVRPSEHSSEPSPVPSHVASPVPSPEHTRVPSPEPTRATSPVPSRMPSPECTSVPFPEPTPVASPVPSSPEHTSRVASPSSAEESPRIKSPSKYPSDFWDDVPKMDLFEPRSEDAKFFAAIPDVPMKDQSDAAATSGGSCVVVTPVRKEHVAQSIGPAASNVQEAKINVSSGPDTHDKKQRQKRAAKDIDTPPKVKKMRLTDTHQATYRKYIGHIRKLRPQKKGVPPKPFVQIGNFYVPYKNFQAVFKPRQYMDNQVMSLFVEKFNIENHLQATRNKRSRKKFAFSVRMTITNFDVLAKETQAFSVDITKLKRGGPTDYPQQPNLFDCSFFTVLYMDKFDGKVMENFDENGIPYFHMIIATDFIKHPMNTEDSAKVFEEETYE
ncbi:hypothetical protein ACQ4PT_009369 [Festuca glaucescens]